MDKVQSRRRVRPARLLLLAGIGGVAWAALSLLSPAPASADDGGDRGSGLLGAVSSTLSGVGDTVESTVGAVDSVVTSVTATVAPVVAPVTAPLPAPVAQPVAEVVHAAPPVVSHVVGAVDAVATGAVDTVTSAVGDVAAATPAGAVVEPVTDLVTEVPIVGDVVAGLGVDDLLEITAGAVDEAVSTVVGTPGPVGSLLPVPPLTALEPIVEVLPSGDLPVLPGLPGLPTLPALPAPSMGGIAVGPVSGSAPALRATQALSAHAPESSRLLASMFAAAADAAVADALDGFSHVLPGSGGAATALPGAAMPAGSGASGQAGAGAAAALGHEYSHHLALGLTGSTALDDDALPGAPVFDTDVAPD